MLNDSNNGTIILICVKCRTQYEVPAKFHRARCPCGCLAVIHKRGKPVLPKGKRRRKD